MGIASCGRQIVRVLGIAGPLASTCRCWAVVVGGSQKVRQFDANQHQTFDVDTIGDGASMCPPVDVQLQTETATKSFVRTRTHRPADSDPRGVSGVLAQRPQEDS